MDRVVQMRGVYSEPWGQRGPTWPETATTQIPKIKINSLNAVALVIGFMQVQALVLPRGVESRWGVLVATLERKPLTLRNPETNLKIMLNIGLKLALLKL